MQNKRSYGAGAKSYRCYLRVITGVLLLSLMVTCGSVMAKTASAPITTGAFSKHSNSKGAQKTISLRIGYIPAVTAGGVPAIGKKLGLFEKAGIDAKFVPFTNGPAQSAAMAGGSLDILYLGAPAIWEAARGGGKIIALSDLTSDGYILSQPDSTIKTIHDLKGKNVLYSQGNASEFILQNALDKAGIPDSAIHKINVHPSSAVSAFIGHRAPAVATYMPFADSIKDKVPSVNVVATTHTFRKYGLPGVYVASNDLLKKHPNAVRRFLKVLVEASDIRSNNRDLAIKATVEFTNTPSHILADQYDEETWPTPKKIIQLYENGKFNALLKIVEKIELQIGALDQVVDPGKFTALGIHTRLLKRYISHYPGKPAQE